MIVVVSSRWYCSWISVVRIFSILSCVVFVSLRCMCVNRVVCRLVVKSGVWCVCLGVVDFVGGLLVGGYVSRLCIVFGGWYSCVLCGVFMMGWLISVGWVVIVLIRVVLFRVGLFSFRLVYVVFLLCSSVCGVMFMCVIMVVRVVWLGGVVR